MLVWVDMLDILQDIREVGPMLPAVFHSRILEFLMSYFGHLLS